MKRRRHRFIGRLFNAAYVIHRRYFCIISHHYHINKACKLFTPSGLQLRFHQEQLTRKHQEISSPCALHARFCSAKRRTKLIKDDMQVRRPLPCRLTCPVGRARCHARCPRLRPVKALSEEMEDFKNESVQTITWGAWSKTRAGSKFPRNLGTATRSSCWRDAWKTWCTCCQMRPCTSPSGPGDATTPGWPSP